MSELIRNQLELALPQLSSDSKSLVRHRKASTPEQSVELREVVTPIHHSTQQKQQSHLSPWRSIQQRQYRRLLILIYLLLGLSFAALALGAVNYLTLHSLQRDSEPIPAKN